MTKNNSKLEQLREEMLIVPYLDIDSLMVSGSDIPVQPTVILIDYEQKKIEFLEESKNRIFAIINNYIQNDKVLEVDKIKSLIKDQIEKLAQIKMLIFHSDRNIITIQQKIDFGEFGKDILDTSAKFQDTHRKNIEMETKHTEKCEKYWETYSKIHELDTKEENVINDEIKSNDTQEDGIVTDARKLNEMIKKIKEEKNT